MHTIPAVSVLLPVYNAQAYIEKALESILGQTWDDLELLLLDDGSTDDSVGIMERYRRNDPRIVLHRLPHAGLVSTLNHGLDIARGTYVARADADDISLSDRIAQQVAFMEQRPEVGICGGWLETLGGGSRRIMPTGADAIRCHLIFGVAVPHPTMMIRRSWIAESGLRYDPEYAHAEDYDLLERASRLTVLANLPAVLVRYREHASQVSRVHSATQSLTARRVRQRQIERLGINANEAELDLHQGISQITYPPHPDFLNQTLRWLERIAEANAATHVYPQAALADALADRLYRIYAESPTLQAADCISFRRATLGPTTAHNRMRCARLLLRAVLPNAVARRAVRTTRALAGD